MAVSLVASHSKGKKEVDKIFGVNRAALEKAAVVGKENVINASIGAFLNAEGDLQTLDSVEEVLRSLPFKETAAYAPIAGLPEYIEAAKKALFGEFMPDCHIRGIGTPGGSGAIHHAIWNYTEPGDTFITTDWFWGPYRTMAREMGRNLETFTTFTEEGGFNTGALAAKTAELAAAQKNVLMLLNTPAHNPTGMTISDDEWDIIIDDIRTRAENKENNYIIFADVAYLDFAPDGSRSFLKKFENLPENILVLVAFTMSKGYTMYGYRSGCLMALSSSEEIVQEFFDVNQFSNRGTWSNCTRAGQAVLAKIYSDPEILAKVDAERKRFKEDMETRAALFMAEARAVELEVLSYHSGFFITIPCPKPEETAMLLREDNIFLVALGRGLRIAVCAVSAEKIKGMAGKIKAAVEKTK